MDDLRDEILELFDNLIESLEEYDIDNGMTRQIEELRDDFESLPVKPGDTEDTV